MKKGISLIVLVITIIVMIIIAGAIILSLSNTNVISKANLSKLTNDRATLTEATHSRTAEYMAAMDGASPPLTSTTNITFAQSIAPTTAMTSQIPAHTDKGDWVFVPATGEWLFKCHTTTALIGAAKTLLGIASTETLPDWIRGSALVVNITDGTITTPAVLTVS